MSGTPNAEGVKQLLELLDVRAELIERLAELKPLMDEKNRKEVALLNTNIAITKTLAAMDVADNQKGNHGHEDRVAALVAMLRDAARANRVDHTEPV